MIAGRPKVTTCLHCGAPPLRKGKCAPCWTKYDSNLKRKAKGLPYEPLPIIPRGEALGRTPKPNPQWATVCEPIGSYVNNGVRITQCPPNFDAEFHERGMGRIEAMRLAGRELAI